MLNATRLQNEAQPTITGNDLLDLGYPESPALGIALSLANQQLATTNRQAVLALLATVQKRYPEFIDGGIYAQLAEALRDHYTQDTIALTTGLPYTQYGAAYIEEGARLQMKTAMQLPVTVAGALMADAHQGYGLPIGGVLATRNAIIPYGVGVDIGCRMCLSIFDIPEAHFLENKMQYKRDLIAYTQFGASAGFRAKERADHAVLESKVFQENKFVGGLKDKAWSQLGSSGGGNHFVEYGIIEVFENDTQFNVPPGKYLALLTHSGSRGMGATIAGHYTKLAKEICKLPKEAANLAYMGLDTQEGQEYWDAMTLAGDYASACHQIIHEKLTKAVGGQLLARVENHHNFAWKEQWNGEEVIVHRKGATPAGEGMLGIIPGSMTAPGFLVSGKGVEAAINSASHGAGRQMSRTKANAAFNRKMMSDLLKEKEIMLIGGGTDEAPGAYKDIHQVMAAQTDLVEVLAQFQPLMVRMADDGSRED